MPLSRQSIDILIDLLNRATLNVGAPDFEPTSKAFAQTKRELLTLKEETE